MHGNELRLVTGLGIYSTLISNVVHLTKQQYKQMLMSLVMSYDTALGQPSNIIVFCIYSLPGGPLYMWILFLV